jgi:primosomal protein N' (replication factor Y)
VILQTYNPHHFSITAARNQDYDAFFRQEIEFRKALAYPPFTRMIQIRIKGKDAKKTSAYVHQLADLCNKLHRAGKDFNLVDVLGPIEAPLARIADHYRWQLLLKSSQPRVLHRFVHCLLFSDQSPKKTRAVSVGVDVDPHFLM